MRRSFGLWFGVWLAACGNTPQMSVTAPIDAPARPASVPTGGLAAVSGGPSGTSAATAMQGPAAGGSRGAALSMPAKAGTVANAGASVSAAVGGNAGMSAGAAGSSTAGVSGAAGTSASAGAKASSGGHGGNGGKNTSGAAGKPAAQMPLYAIPLRVHTQASKLTEADLMPVFAELNAIWQNQAGICFDIEVTTSEDNRTDGFDFRYTSGRIPGASSANGLTQNAHEIWSIDHPQLNAAPHPVMNPTARTTAHELGHALGLAHENPPPSTDCAMPCYCAERGDDCDDYLLRSGTKGFFISPPEIDITRKNAAKSGKAADGCAAPTFMH